MKLKATKLGDGHYEVTIGARTIELDRVEGRWIGVWSDTGDEAVNAETKRGALEALAHEVTPYDQARAELPDVVATDPRAERTVRQLAVWVRHEIDMHTEGHNVVSRKVFNALVGWLRKHQPDMIATLDRATH